MAIERHEGVDWSALREEYLAGSVGQKALAEKHGVPYSALRHRAAEEGWKALRDARAGQQEDSDAQIARRTRRKMLMKLERMAETMPADPVTERKTQEGSTVSLFKLRDLTAAYKELTGDMTLDGGEAEALRVIVDP